MRALLAVLVLLLAGCAAPAGDAPAAVAPPDDGPVVRFLVLGDTGTGGDGQRAVAQAAWDVCAQRGCDFAIVNGDNIYESGVTSAYDDQFVSKFEEPYAAFDIPFYLVLGNHDSSLAGGEGLDMRRGDFQVEYSYRTDRESDKWNMPARYYEFHWGHVHVVGLDTNSVDTGGDLQGVQQRAVADAVAKSNGTWTFAFGHHPLFSNGLHGDASTERPGAPPLLRDFLMETVCGKVDVYFAGHDHDLQWLKPHDACGETQFIVSGAGGKTRRLQENGANDAYFQQGDTLGFFWMQASETALEGAVFDDAGSLLFSMRYERSSS